MFKKKKKIEKNEYFLKISLTNTKKIAIDIGWPVSDKEGDIIYGLHGLLEYITNDKFPQHVINTLQSIDNTTLQKVLSNINLRKTDYVNPLDVL